VQDTASGSARAAYHARAPCMNDIVEGPANLPELQRDA
jgi:hypothetical protein